MAMIDSFFVRKENKVGIPVTDEPNGYETKDLGCTLGHFVIDENGFITLEQKGSNYNGDRIYELLTEDKKLSYRDLNIYTLNKEDGSLNHLFLTVVENQIVRVSDSDREIYSNPEYMFHLGEVDDVMEVGKICPTVDYRTGIPDEIRAQYKLKG